MKASIIIEGKNYTFEIIGDLKKGLSQALQLAYKDFQKTKKTEVTFMPEQTPIEATIAENKNKKPVAP